MFSLTFYYELKLIPTKPHHLNEGIAQPAVSPRRMYLVTAFSNEFGKYLNAHALSWFDL